MKHKFTTIILLSGLFFVNTLKINAQNTDFAWLKQINQSNAGFKPVSVFLSETTKPMIIAVPLIVGGIGLLTDNNNLLYDAAYIIGASAVNYTITYSLKKVVNRPRPYESYPQDINNYQILDDASMPSGHTSGAFATATALSLKYPKWYIIAPSYLWAASVGYSRMHLGVHYPSDVLAGAVVGAGSAWLTWKANEWFHDKYEIRKFRILKKNGLSEVPAYWE
jgi:membrane-associated phospholipid phosphatase